MKFLMDANLPYKLADLLKGKGYDVIHTDDLPEKERTKDATIRKISKYQKRIIITKDTDFLDSHFIQEVPAKLLLVTTGNIDNRSLFLLFETYFDAIAELFNSFDLIELSSDNIVGYES